MTVLSVIIPTLNESENIKQTLAFIRQELGSINHEVIVSDNGSVDDTVAQAQAAGAQVTINPATTIAGLRNQGVQISSGTVLVFFDADVHPGPGWLTQLTTRLDLNNPSAQIITGSRCRSSHPTNFLTRYWFERMPDTGSLYINSGHLITTRAVFDRLQGFDETRHTGEDYDFCQRARALGVDIQPDPALVAFHRHYPTTLPGFIGREIWHGRSDMASWRQFLSSTVAVIATFMVILLMVGIVLVVPLRSPLPLLLALLLIFGLSWLMTLKKFGRAPPGITLRSTGILMAYLFSRFCSLFAVGKRVHRE